MFLYNALWLLPVAAASVIPHVTNNDTTYDNEVEPRVRFGTPASITDHPYYASLDFCGAVIISNSWILTAAHCVDDINNGKLWVGGDCHSNSQEVYFNKIIIHPKYDKKELDNDIALLKLSKPLRFSDKIKPISLPNSPKLINKSLTYIFVGKGVDETGKQPICLKKSEMKIHPASQCIVHGPKNQTDSMFLCIERADDHYSVCSGDSGSPLVFKNVLIGLASWGYKDFIAGTECRLGKGFVVNVITYVPWIKQVITKS